MYALSVVQPFADYKVGDRIEDPEAVEAILESEHAAFVVRVSPDDKPVHIQE